MSQTSLRNDSVSQYVLADCVRLQISWVREWRMVPDFCPGYLVDAGVVYWARESYQENRSDCGRGCWIVCLHCRFRVLNEFCTSDDYVQLYHWNSSFGWWLYCSWCFYHVFSCAFRFGNSSQRMPGTMLSALLHLVKRVVGKKGGRYSSCFTNGETEAKRLSNWK